MQWKCYLSMLEADRFVYNIFEIKIEGPLAWMDGSGNDATGSHMVTEVTVKDIHQMTFYRYPGMEEDIRDEVARFRDFVLSNPALTLA